MVSTEDKLITIDDLVLTKHCEKEKGERIMVYLKERCDCGGRITVGSYRDMYTYPPLGGVGGDTPALVAISLVQTKGASGPTVPGT